MLERFLEVFTHKKSNALFAEAIGHMRRAAGKEKVDVLFAEFTVKADLALAQLAKWQ